MEARPTALVLAALTAAWPGRGAADEGTAGIFVRADSDHTVVVTPRAAVAVGLGDRTKVTAAYTADVWTSASIDVRTAATRRITEQRDEIDLGGSYELDDVTMGASWYFSHENDYRAQAVSAYAVEELADGNTTVEERLTFDYDVVGRSGDPWFERPAMMLGGRVALTQIIDRDTLIQGVYELSLRQGYQSSPYRFVGLGGDGLCGGTAVLCVPEAHPDSRWRHAVVVQARRALSDDSSLGLSYRLYRDSWGVLSHTGAAQLAWITGEDTTLTFRYRFYSQSEASFYRSAYPEPTGQLRYVTRDRELSPMFSNRLAVQYETLFHPGDAGLVLRLAVAVGGTAFVYRDFVGLGEVYALDTSLAMTLEL